MRQIGSIQDRELAERFTAYLIAKEIDVQGELEDDHWNIWVRDEDQLPEAREAFDEFMAAPNDERYHGAEREAQVKLRDQQKRREEAKKNLVEMRQHWSRPAAKRAPLTVAIIVLSVVVAFLTSMGRADQSVAMRSLRFCDPIGEVNWDESSLADRTVDLRRGQIWRAVTPIFIHYDIFHLLFNMAWLWIFGSRIEERRGTARLGAMILAIAVLSNLAQGMMPLRWDGGVGFGGMSGVVYGLLGYLWMKTIYDPGSGLHVSRFTFGFLMFFMLIGFTGVMEGGGLHIANWAHGVGFLTGVAIGYAPVATGGQGK